MTLKSILFAGVLASLSAISYAQDAEVLSIDSKKEVAYQCKMGNADIPFKVMYGIKDNRIVVAQGKLNEQLTPGLFPLANPMPMLDYYLGNNGEQTEWSWTTFPTTAENITRVDGGTLAQGPIDRSQPQVIILENCKLNKTETAKLNQQ